MENCKHNTPPGVWCKKCEREEARAIPQLPRYHDLPILYRNDPDSEHLRFGQWFMNRYATSDTWPALFYEPRKSVALHMIWEHYYGDEK